MILQYNSSGSLYSLQCPVAPSSSCALVVAAATPDIVWHRCLGHPGNEALSKLSSTSAISFTHHSSVFLCHACQLGNHIRLLFRNSSSRAIKNFDLIHCDLLTSPMFSVSSYKYYLVILDDRPHFLWTFPLRLKSETFPTLTNFFPICTPNLAEPSKVFSVTMAMNLTIHLLGASFLSTTSSYTCLAHIPPPKMARLNALFAPLIILCVLFSSRLPCLFLIGLKDLTLPPIY